MNSNVENPNKKAGEKRKSIISTTSAERRSSITGLSDDSFYIENSTPVMASSGDEDKINIEALGVRVECSTCNVRLGPQAMTMHLQGKPHLKKVEHLLMEDSKFNWCPVCSVQLSSLKQAFSHCMSKQHCEKLLKQQGVDLQAQIHPKRKHMVAIWDSSNSNNSRNQFIPVNKRCIKQFIKVLAGS